MNKKILYVLGILLLVVLGYFALQKEDVQSVDIPQTEEMVPHEMDPSAESGLDLVKDAAPVPFNKSYTIDEEWSMKVSQFEPNAKISGPGEITSDSNTEENPAVKVDFYKNGEFVHYQIAFKEMPGFHSIKPNQKYVLEFINYKGFEILEDNNYSIDIANLTIRRIK